MQPRVTKVSFGVFTRESCLLSAFTIAGVHLIADPQSFPWEMLAFEALFGPRLPVLSTVCRARDLRIIPRRSALKAAKRNRSLSLFGPPHLPPPSGFPVYCIPSGKIGAWASAAPAAPRFFSVDFHERSRERTQPMVEAALGNEGAGAQFGFSVEAPFGQ